MSIVADVGSRLTTHKSGGVITIHGAKRQLMQNPSPPSSGGGRSLQPCGKPRA